MIAGGQGLHRHFEGHVLKLKKDIYTVIAAKSEPTAY